MVKGHRRTHGQVAGREIDDALACQPQLLLADEPLASLDPRLAEELLALLLREAEAPRALLLSLHRPDLLAGFDRAIGLRGGRLQFDLPLQAIRPEQLQELYAGSGELVA